MGQRALLEPERDAVPGGGLAESRAGTEAFLSSARLPNTSFVFLIETPGGRTRRRLQPRRGQARARTASLGIWIDEERWNEGLGTDAVRTLCRFGFREMNLRRIELHVYDFNERGVRAYEKVGFRGRDGFAATSSRTGARRRRRHGPARDELLEADK